MSYKSTTLNLTLLYNHLNPKYKPLTAKLKNMYGAPVPHFSNTGPKSIGYSDDN